MLTQERVEVPVVFGQRYWKRRIGHVRLTRNWHANGRGPMMRVKWTLGMALVLVACATRAGEGEWLWSEATRVANGDGYRGAWRMNESQFLFVDDPQIELRAVARVGTKTLLFTTVSTQPRGHCECSRAGRCRYSHFRQDAGRGSFRGCSSMRSCVRHGRHRIGGSLGASGRCG